MSKDSAPRKPENSDEKPVGKPRRRPSKPSAAPTLKDKSDKKRKPRKWSKKQKAFGGLIAVGLFTFAHDGWYVLQPNEISAEVQFGVVRGMGKQGLNFKLPYITQVYIMDGGLKSEEIDPKNVFSRDQQPLKETSTTVFYHLPSDLDGVRTLFNDHRGTAAQREAAGFEGDIAGYIEHRIGTLLDDFASQDFREAVGTLSASEITTGVKDEDAIAELPSSALPADRTIDVPGKIMDRIAESSAGLGVSIDYIVTRPRFDEEYYTAAKEVRIQELNAKAARYEADAQAERGQGESRRLQAIGEVLEQYPGLVDFTYAQEGTLPSVLSIGGKSDLLINVDVPKARKPRTTTADDALTSPSARRLADLTRTAGRGEN